jgi:hypothetical protein
LPTAASSQSVKIQALVNESFRFKPQPSCKSKRNPKKNSNFSHLLGQLQLQGRVSKFKLSLMRASDSYPSLNASENENQKENQTSLTHKASCQLELQARVSKFKLLLTRASDSYPNLDASQKKMKKKFKLLTLTGPAANCSFKLEYQNSSSH